LGHAVIDIPKRTETNKQRYRHADRNTARNDWGEIKMCEKRYVRNSVNAVKAYLKVAPTTFYLSPNP